MNVKYEAKCFAIWRTIKNHDHVITRRQIAEITGVPYSTVRKIIKRKGWACEPDPSYRTRFKNRPGIDQLMKRPGWAKRDQ